MASSTVGTSSNAVAARSIRLAAAIALAWACSIQVAGACSMPGTGDGPCTAAAASMPEADAPSMLAGNPIHLATGNKFQHETDLAALPGTLGIELERNYNSRTGYQGLFGQGWRMSYEAVAYSEPTNIQIVQADGRRMIFTRDRKQPSLCATERIADGTVEETDRQYVWRWPNGRTLSFAKNGRLEEIRERDGAQVSLAYDPRGSLATVTDSQGRQLSFDYRRDAGGRRLLVSAVRTPVGTWHYAYDSRNNLVEASAPVDPSIEQGQQVTRLYHYENELNGGDPFNLTGISVRIGAGQTASVQRLSSYRYDSRDRAVESIPADRSDAIKVSYEIEGTTDTVGRVVPGMTRVTNAIGVSTDYRWSVVAGSYALLEAKGTGCRLCPPGDHRYRYDAQGRMVADAALDAGGRPTAQYQVGYDTRGRVTRREFVALRADGKPVNEAFVETQVWDDTLNLPVRIARSSVVTGRQHVTEIRYNERGQALQVIERGFAPGASVKDAPTAIERSIEWRYAVVSGVSQPVSRDGPLPGADDTTRYQYDNHGRLVAIQLPETSLVVRYKLDDAGRVVEATGIDGIVQTWRLDPAGQVAQSQRAGAVFAIDRDARGRPVKAVAPDGEVRWFGYDGPAGLGATVSNTGEGSWRLSTVQAPMSKSAPSAPVQRTVSAVAPVTPAPREARLDADDPRVAALAWGRVRQLSDDFGRRLYVSTRDTGLETRRYDNADRLIERRFADGTTWTLQRDVVGRVVKETEARDGTAPVVTTLHYTGARLDSLDNPQESESRSYDAAGHVAAVKTRRADGTQFSETYEYDSADRLVRQTLAEGGELRYRWNIGQRIAAIDFIDVAGRRQSIIDSDRREGYRFGNGIEARSSFDAQGRLVRLEHRLPEAGNPRWWTAWLPSATAADETRIVDIGLRYDDDSRLAARTDGTTTRQLGYDWAGRLAVEAAGADASFYAWSDEGAPLGRRIGQQTLDFRSDAITRDVSGLPSAIGDRQLRYGVDRRLSEVRSGDAVLARYAYNARGERIAKATSDRRQAFLYSRRHLSAESLPDDPSRIARRYVYANNVPVATIDYDKGRAFATTTPAGDSFDAGATLARWRERVFGSAPRIAFIHADETGAPAAVTTPDRRVIWRATRTGFDVIPVAARNDEASPYELNLRLPGQYADRETGWYDNYQRTYDPKRAQYLEPDPLGPAAMTQPFSYAAHNPYTQADPLGLILFSFDGTGNTPASNTNVLLFAQAYDDLTDFDIDRGYSGSSFYIQGVGTEGGIWDNAVTGGALAIQLRNRINDQLGNFDRYLKAYAKWEADRRAAAGESPMSATDKLKINLDTVGFSRGAAESREFLNMVADRIDSGYYDTLLGGPCVDINLRMAALFDTVLGTNTSSFGAQVFRMPVPERLQFAAQALAADEYRPLFPVELLNPSPASISGGSDYQASRIERAFVGAHSDIGGGYNGAGGDGGDLSDVALNWMVAQAATAGVKMKALPTQYTEITNPIVHDASRSAQWTAMFQRNGDRDVRYRGLDPNGTGMSWDHEKSITWPGGMNWELSKTFIDYYKSPGFFDTKVGTIKGCDYYNWLNSNYGMNWKCTPS